MVIYIAPEPSLRGTLTIVLKCSVTQLFCAYTVLRTNVPASVWKGRGVLAVQTLVGCIWPELILWFALSQYFRAKKVRDRVNEVARALSLARVDAPRRSLWERLTSGSEQKTFTLDPSKTTHPSFDQWTMFHGFYAVSGGYRCLDIASQDSNSVATDDVGSHDVLRPLTPAAIIQIATNQDLDLLNTIPLDNIAGATQSQSTGFIISVIEALYFCLSVYLRWHRDLDISLLELATSADVLIAVFQLISWWYKPSNYPNGHDIEIDSSRLQRLRTQVRDSNLFERFGTQTLWFYQANYDDAGQQDALSVEEGSFKSLIFWSIIGLHAGIHLLYQDSHFSSRLQQKVWLASACSLVVLAGTIVFVSVSDLAIRYLTLYLRDRPRSKNSLAIVAKTDQAIEDIRYNINMALPFFASIGMVALLYLRAEAVYNIFTHLPEGPNSVYQSAGGW